jgi:hypothetical protein
MRRVLPWLICAAGLWACESSVEDTGPADATADAGTADTGLVDLGTTDTGAADRGVDAGFLDATFDDATANDTGPTDTGIPDQRPEDCDPLQPEVCMFPWPSDLYLVPDPTRLTGVTLRFGPTTLPKNRAGVRIDPAPYTRMDGYGLGTPIMMLFPNLDPTQLYDETQIEDSLGSVAPIWLLEDTGEGYRRVPYFAELDQSEADPARRTLFVRPAVILNEQTRYVVIVRGLRDTNGTVYPKSPAFAALLAGNTTDPLLQPRQERFVGILGVLDNYQIDPDEVQLAWEFNTASSQGLHSRLLSMRDQALAFVGLTGPAITIDSTEEFVPVEDGSGRPVDPDMRYRVEGTITVPSFLTNKTIAFVNHTVLNLDANGVPQRGPDRDVHFWMVVPHSTASATISHGLIQYGHGLLGSGSQTMGGHNRKIANTHHYVIFGCDLAGFSEAEELPVGIAVNDMTAFEWIGDTIHQGLIDYLVLGRAMQGRLASDPFFTSRGILIDPSRFYYSGISQGGIFGGTYMAISTDVTRGHLGVPGINYNLLLHRSVDFTPFFEMMRVSYPSVLDQNINLGLAQLLWDGTDPVSYYRHISNNPFIGTPAHTVLAAPAKGDWQVAVLSMEIVARTTGLGFSLLADYDDERTPYGVSPVPYPRSGSGIVLYDFGNPWPAPGNVPPNDALGDPHGLPRRLDAHNRQMDHFFRTGEIIDVCGGDGCHPE